MLNLRQHIKGRLLAGTISPMPRVEMFCGLLRYGAWRREHPFPLAFPGRAEMCRYLHETVLQREPITYLEFGVWQGESIRYWSQLDQNPASQFWGFDTFEGLPEAWEHVSGTTPKSTFHVGGALPKIDDPRVSFRKGLFQETLPDFLAAFTPPHRLVVHCDADLYTSTLYVLTRLHSLLRPGTIVMFDEFSAPEEFRAFLDYGHSYRKNWKPLATAGGYFTRAAFEVR